MKEIVAYTVVEKTIPDDEAVKKFATTINDWIGEGWQPYGSLTSMLYPETSETFYAQTMVKYKR